MKTMRKKLREQGQVLVFAIVILVILLIASLFLFDLHSIVRSKMKLDTAEQSAALAAGKWQARSLNLIGDINYAKAVDVLLDDIGTGETEVARITSANKTLTEMQSRISFCGPLIAFGAAQQAAKNNGINTYESGSQGDYKTVTSDMRNYLMKLDPSSEYYNYGDKTCSNYYYWQGPYVTMLEAITDQGLVVRPNGRFPGIESVDPPWLDDESLYSAILNRMWCNPTLNSIVKYPDSYWNGRWWNVDFEHTSFPDESEIYTLGVTFTGPLEQGILERALDETLTPERVTKLAPIRWCVYDNRWARYNTDGVTESLSYSGPNNGGFDYWRRGMFLRSNLKDSMFYGGPVAYAECYQRIKLMNKYKSRMTRPYGANSPYAGSDQMAKARTALQNNIVRETSSETLKVGNDASTDSSSGGAVAKPIWSKDFPPTDLLMVLPYFSDVALIPSTMQSCRPLRVDFSMLERFLIWLSTVDDLHNPGSAPPDGTQQYLTALQTLDDPTFRKSGWNNDYVRDDSDISIYFGDAYKYDPESNPNGAGWLQQIWRSTDIYMDDDDVQTEMQERAAGWNTRIYSGRSYILRDRNGNLVSNEQMTCRWTPGGPGTHVPGVRTGPPHL